MLKDPKVYVKINRIRRMLDRQGFRMTASRRHDPRARDYDRFNIIDMETEKIVFGDGKLFRHNATLDQCERWANGGEGRNDNQVY